VVAGPANLDELYTNDGLYRLQEMKRGSLTGGGTGIADVDFKQDWTLDPTGNWGEFKEYANGSTLSLDQTRTSSTVNEIMEFTTGTGTHWSPPDYDSAGNMISMPRPNSLADAYTGIFDAWNRLAKLGTGSGDEFVPVQVNAYDGRNFRLTRLSYSGGELSETRDFYQSLSWSVLEERVSAAPDRQYVWGLRYIDDLVLRDRSNGGTLNERLYGLQDANWNMVAVCDESGDVQERFNYTTYGVCTPLNPDFSSPYSGTNYDWTLLFTGRELDSATGLYYYRHRQYLAELGGFVSRDPLYRDANLYRYCFSRPTSFTDPSGMAASNAAALLPGSRVWTSAGNAYTTDAQLTAVAEDGSTITLKMANGTTKEVPVSKLSTADQGLVAGLIAVPPNVVVDPCEKKGKAGDSFREAVITAFANIAKTTAGAQVVKDVGSVAQPGTMFLNGKQVPTDPTNKTPMTIVPSGADNSTTYQRPTGAAQPATDVVVHYNPDQLTGDLVVGGGSRERPPFVGLDKELSTAARALKGSVGTVMDEERASRKCENQLRKELHLPEARMP
jgi:RHS repeat-associated protein